MFLSPFILLFLCLSIQRASSFTIPSHLSRRKKLNASPSFSTKVEGIAEDLSQEIPTEVDAIVIGAGIGGLSCAALSAKYGLETLCVEAHDVPGGCAHSFDRFSSASKVSGKSGKIPFQFDSGPSLLSGMSSMGTNPLRQVLDAVEVTDLIEWKLYDGWIVHDYADGKKFKLTTGNTGKFSSIMVPCLYPYIIFSMCKLIDSC